MDFFPTDLQLRDLIAVAALVVSGSVYWRSRRNDKRDLFLKVHEQLLNPELVEGRRLLYDLGSVGDVERMKSEDRTKVYRLLAMYDLMGMYAERGWIGKSDVLAEWGDSLARSDAPGRHFIEYRERINATTWPHYQGLRDSAVARPRKALSGRGSALSRRPVA